jgi:hypothetical protein
VREPEVEVELTWLLPWVVLFPEPQLQGFKEEEEEVWT